MVKEFIAPVRVYEYPFELVMKAYERRFPTTPHLPSFVGSEILNEYKSDDGSIHVVERRCQVSVTLPYLLKKIAGVDHLFFLQKNTLDNAKRILKIEARNESFSGKVAVKELCYYKVHPDNSNWTIFEQKADIEMLNFYGFESMIEKFGLKTYASQIKKAKEVLPIFIEELKNEGITHVPIFKKNSTSNITICDTSLQHVVTLPSPPLEKVSECVSDENSISNTTIEQLSSLDLNIDDDIYSTSDNLSLIEENCLINMKRKWEKKHTGNTIIDDMDLLRFLRGCKLNEKRAHERLLNYIKWRATNNVDMLLDSWMLDPNLKPYYLGGWHHHDNDGRPVYIIKLGQMDLKGMLKCIGCNSFIKHIIFQFEESLCKLKALRNQCNENSHLNITCIVDLDGLTMRHAWRPITRTCMKLLEISERYYPETLGKVIITNTPKFFTLIWPLVQAIIADETKKKFFIYPKNATDINTLKEHIPEEFIPKFLNGTAQLPFDDPPTQLIPKSLYLECYSNDDQHLENSIIEYNYKSVTITKLHQHCITIPVDEVDNVISWDFDVLEGALLFRIAFSHSLTLHSDKRSLTDVPDHKSCIHNEGSSIQGSFVCNSIGTYCLIWEYSDMTQVVKPKTKFIYYYEVIPPQRFRNSLHSLNSSLSNLSQFDSFDCRYSQHVE